MGLNFFGLHPENKEQVFLEPLFLLMYYGGFTYSEAYSLPISYKYWFIQRISKEINKGSEKGESQSRAVHHNSPDVRALQGKTRNESPSRLRRFS